MTVEVAICDQLLADDAVAALVGTRVYQQKLPQRPTLPAISVKLIDDDMGYHLRGEVAVTRARVQVDAFAAEVSDEDEYDPKTRVDAVAAAAHVALSGRKFAVGSPPEIEITGVFRESRRPMYEAEEMRLYRVLQDYLVWSKPA